MSAICRVYVVAYNGVPSPTTPPYTVLALAFHCRAYFIKYPRNLQYSEFSNSGDVAKASAVSAWSSDGQEILLEIGFYYRLPKDNLINLYLEIGGTDNGHDDVVNKLDHLVLNIAAETFRHVSTKFETRQFFTERLAVKEAMHQELVARLETFQITVPRFQLLDIDVPASFADAVEDTVIAAQLRRTLAIERSTRLIKAETELINTRANAAIRIVNAQATADGLLITTAARANATVALQQQRATSLSELAASLGFSNVTDTGRAALLRFVYYKTLQDMVDSSSQPNLLLGVPKGLVQL